MPLKLEDSRGYTWARRIEPSHRDAEKKKDQYSAKMSPKLEDSRGYAWKRPIKSSHSEAEKKEGSKGDGDRSHSIMKWVAGKRGPIKGNDQQDRSRRFADLEEGFRISAELCNANRR